MLFASIEDSHDVRMAQAPGRFGLAKKTLLDLGKLVSFEFLRERHRFDRDDPADFRIPAEVDDAHGALAQLLFHLVAPQHGLLGSTAKHQIPAGMALRAAEDYR